MSTVQLRELTIQHSVDHVRPSKQQSGWKLSAGQNREVDGVNQ